MISSGFGQGFLDGLYRSLSALRSTDQTGVNSESSARRPGLSSQCWKVLVPTEGNITEHCSRISTLAQSMTPFALIKWLIDTSGPSLLEVGLGLSMLNVKPHAIKV